MSESQLAASFDLRDPRIAQSLARLSQEIQTTADGRKYLIESLVTALMVDLGRHLREVETASTQRGLAAWQLQRIKQHLEEEENFSATSRDLARICGISQSRLQRGFKAATGVNLHGYKESVRLERAKSLLLYSELPLKVISGQLGFSSLSGLSIAFRRATGESPRGYRQRYQQPNA